MFMLKVIGHYLTLCCFFSSLSTGNSIRNNRQRQAGRSWQKSFDNINTERDICEEVASFTPNFCSYSAAQQYCNDFCDIRVDRDQLTCGKKYLPGEQVLPPFRRVVGGTESKSGEWPWQVSLRLNGTQWCGGSILSERFIMTAAHCFDAEITSVRPSDWEIYAGDHALYTEDVFEQRVRVKRIFIPKDYALYLHEHHKGSWVTADHDIAIMELTQPINLKHQHKGQVCLPDNYQPIKPGSHCHVVGWGHTSYGGIQPNHLMHAVVMVIPTNICNLEVAYNHTVKGKYLLCAGYEQGGRDACNYDSGGAMVCIDKGNWYATGIVSSGFECARANAYGLYTRISTDKEWIVDTLLKKGDKVPRRRS